MNILILGNALDAHATHLHDALMQAGAIADYLDTRKFPTQIGISWEPNNQMGWLNLSSERHWQFQDIKSVFWRSFHGVGIPSLKDSHQQQVAFNDAMSAVRMLMQTGPARWVNSWQAYQFHKEKPLQLRQVQLLGVKIPPTLISNDPEQIIRFAQSHQQVISKPVYGGAHARILTDSHLEPKRLKLALSIAPITLQQYIPGTNIRSYVIADSVYAAEIRSNSLDFREDSETQLLPVDLPAVIQRQCLAIAQALHLEWTAIDWRKTPVGEYVFLEANPSPMFIHFEQQTGFPITEKLVKLLMA
ncbi:hypothetical protein IQ238_00730 [Pleurocapsales cyanobacterium LEGE 06147]|nr:hypothetical protein [Pleurocapsales cyanobacterium LEGE 06147]